MDPLFPRSWIYEAFAFVRSLSPAVRDRAEAGASGEVARGARAVRGGGASANRPHRRTLLSSLPLIHTISSCLLLHVLGRSSPRPCSLLDHLPVWTRSNRPPPSPRARPLSFSRFFRSCLSLLDFSVASTARSVNLLVSRLRVMQLRCLASRCTPPRGAPVATLEKRSGAGAGEHPRRGFFRPRFFTLVGPGAAAPFAPFINEGTASLRCCFRQRGASESSPAPANSRGSRGLDSHLVAHQRTKVPSSPLST